MNTITRYLNGRAPIVRVRMGAVPRSELAVSTIVVAELPYGAAKNVNPAKALAAQDELHSLSDASHSTKWRRTPLGRQARRENTKNVLSARMTYSLPRPRCVGG
jgi:hypothetical protein